MRSLSNQGHYTLARTLVTFQSQGRVPQAFRAQWKQVFAVDPVIEAGKYIKEWRRYSQMMWGSLAVMFFCIAAFSVLISTLDAPAMHREGKVWIIVGVLLALTFLGFAFFFWSTRRNVRILRTERHQHSYENRNEILFLFIVENLAVFACTRLSKDKLSRMHGLKGPVLVLALQRVLYRQSQLLETSLGELCEQKEKRLKKKKLAQLEMKAQLLKRRHNELRWHLSMLKYLNAKADGRKQD